MRLGNGTKIGLATVLGVLLAALMFSLFFWRLSVGDTPGEASAYVLLILGTLSGLITAGFRWWQNVRISIGGGDS